MEFNSGATTYFVVSFESIATEGKVKIGQIIPGEGWDCSNADMISTVNNLGVQVNNYTYFEGNWYACDDGGNPEGDPIDETTELDTNMGIVIYSGDAYQLTCSGAVPVGECEMIIEPGATTYTGNFTPAALKIGDIVPGEGWDCSNADMLSTVNELGVQVDNYTYFEGDWYVCDDGGNPEGDPINETVSFEPNKGFVIYSGDCSSLTFPSPL